MAGLEDPFTPTEPSPEEELRRAVRDAISDGVVTEDEKARLHRLCRELGVSNEDASRIFREAASAIDSQADAPAQDSGSSTASNAGRASGAGPSVSVGSDSVVKANVDSSVHTSIDKAISGDLVAGDRVNGIQVKDGGSLNIVVGGIQNHDTGKANAKEEYEERVDAILDDEDSLETAKRELDGLRRRLRLSFGTAKEIESACLKARAEYVAEQADAEAIAPPEAGSPEPPVPGLSGAGNVAGTSAVAVGVPVETYCSICGAALTEKSFRCTRCGRLHCADCRSDRWPMCRKCAQNIQSRSRQKGESLGSATSATTVADHGTGSFVEIPGGEFLMGRKKKRITIPTFWISTTLVTCREYAAFLDETKYVPGGRVRDVISRRSGDHPVGNVTFKDAQEYAQWRECSLPTEQQWEKAARGKDGRKFPWGEGFSKEACNVADSGGQATVAVAELASGCSPYGCYHMAGNVWEWTVSWYDPLKTERGIRGGSYLEGSRMCTCYYREGINPQFFKPDLGFRCVREKGER